MKTSQVRFWLLVIVLLIVGLLMVKVGFERGLIYQIHTELRHEQPLPSDIDTPGLTARVAQQ